MTLAANQVRLDLHATVGEWVARHPSTARVFERLGIDYCCGGKRPLGEACRERQVDAQEILQQLNAALESSSDDEVLWTERSLADLCDHIEQTHHAYLKTELPRLTDMIAKVVNAHGERHSELAALQHVFQDLRSELEPHMFKEERILFPAIRQMERAAALPQFPFGSVENPIHVMEEEHEHAGQCLARIRELTGDFHVPDDACNTYRVMLASLEELEADMHQHVHKENNILFPHAAEMESQPAEPLAN